MTKRKTILFCLHLYLLTWRTHIVQRIQVRKSIAAALEIVGDLAVSAFVFGQPTSVLSVVLGGTIVFSVIVYSTSARVDRPALSEKDSEDKPVTT